MTFRQESQRVQALPISPTLSSLETIRATLRVPPMGSAFSLPLDFFEFPRVSLRASPRAIGFRDRLGTNSISG